MCCGRSFGTGSIPKSKPTSPIDRHISTKRRRGGSSGQQFFALLLTHQSTIVRRELCRTRNCRLCGSASKCKGLLGCWCRSMDISREQLGELSKRTSDCICPNCLGTKMETIPEFPPVMRHVLPVISTLSFGKFHSLDEIIVTDKVLSSRNRSCV